MRDADPTVPHAIDPIAFGMVPVILLGVALLGRWIPARRAVRVDPAAALKGE